MGSPCDKGTLWYWKDNGLGAGDDNRWRRDWGVSGWQEQRGCVRGQQGLTKGSYSSLRMPHGTFRGEKAISYHLNHGRNHMVHLWGKFKEHNNELLSQAWSKHRESIVIAKPQVSYRSSFLPRSRSPHPSSAWPPGPIHTLTHISPQNCPAFESLACGKRFKTNPFFLYSHFIGRLESARPAPIPAQLTQASASEHFNSVQTSTTGFDFLE